MWWALKMNTRKGHLHRVWEVIGSQNVWLACALPHCPVEDKLRESHQDVHWETHQRLVSLSALELRTINSCENSELSPQGPLGGIVTGLRGLREPGSQGAIFLNQSWSHIPKSVLRTMESAYPVVPESQMSQQSVKGGGVNWKPVLTLFHWVLFPPCANVTLWVWERPPETVGESANQ